jgi:rare lipoprotein A (peptidoglycan hydrolase)
VFVDSSGARLVMSRLLSLFCGWWALFGFLPAQAGQHHTGMASFYAAVPDQSDKFTAAHRSLPFDTMVSVSRIDTGAHVVVRINDRGPFIAGRIIDLSHPAAERLGITGVGLARVTIQVIPAPVRAVRMVQDRGAMLSCPMCRLPPLLE